MLFMFSFSSADVLLDLGEDDEEPLENSRCWAQLDDRRRLAVIADFLDSLLLKLLVLILRK